MIKDALTAVRTALSQIEELAYVAEDWEQLESTDQETLSFPCALIDLATVDYLEAGLRMQTGTGMITVRVVDKRPGVPQSAEDFRIFDLMQAVYAAIQGLQGETFTPLSRIKMARVQHKDMLREFALTFSFGFTDYLAIKKIATTTVSVPADIEIDRKIN